MVLINGGLRRSRTTLRPGRGAVRGSRASFMQTTKSQHGHELNMSMSQRQWRGARWDMAMRKRSLAMPEGGDRAPTPILARLTRLPRLPRRRMRARGTPSCTTSPPLPRFRAAVTRPPTNRTRPHPRSVKVEGKKCLTAARIAVLGVGWAGSGLAKVDASPGERLDGAEVLHVPVLESERAEGRQLQPPTHLGAEGCRGPKRTWDGVTGRDWTRTVQTTASEQGGVVREPS